jgi:hypothetical protein
VIRRGHCANRVVERMPVALLQGGERVAGGGAGPRNANAALNMLRAGQTRQGAVALAAVLN